MRSNDVGLAVARVPTGLLLMSHGSQKLFGWFGGDGLEKTGRMMQQLAYRGGKAMALLAGITEVASGAAIVTGAGTPLAAAGVVGVMTNAALSAHRSAGLWNQNGGYEYPLVLSTLAVGLAAHGPGDLSVDEAARLHVTGPRWAAAAVGVGLATALAVLSTRETSVDKGSDQQPRHVVADAGTDLSTHD